MPRRHRSVVVLGDVHAPWQCKKTLRWALDFIYQVQPWAVVQVGDLYDFYSFSRYAKSLNLMTPRAEVQAGRAVTEDMWTRICRLSPKSKNFQLRGNHDVRIEATVSSKAPELEGLLNTRALFEFDGVETIHDPSEELELDGVTYIHGHRKQGDHARHNQGNTALGHLHTGYVHYFRNRKGVYWELNAGLLGDLKAPVFNYRPQKKVHSMTNGLGYVDAQGPRFIAA